MTLPSNIVENSPLAEVNPQAIKDIMDKDPLKITDKEVAIVVADLRAKRKDFIKKTTIKASTKKIAATLDLSLDDLMG